MSKKELKAIIGDLAKWITEQSDPRHLKPKELLERAREAIAKKEKAK